MGIVRGRKESAVVAAAARFLVDAVTVELPFVKIENLLGRIFGFEKERRSGGLGG